MKNGKLKKIISPQTLEKQFWIDAKETSIKKIGRKRPYVLGK